MVNLVEQPGTYLYTLGPTPLIAVKVWRSDVPRASIDLDAHYHSMHSRYSPEVLRINLELLVNTLFRSKWVHFHCQTDALDQFSSFLRLFTVLYDSSHKVIWVGLLAS